MSVTASLKALQRVPCIKYPVEFQNNKVQALVNSGSEVNVMTSAYATKLDFIAQKISIGAQKIDGSQLETYGIVSASFFLLDSLENARFLEETFLLADIMMEVILGMPFLVLSNTDFSLMLKSLPGGLTPLQKPYSPLVRSNLLIKENLLKWP